MAGIGLDASMAADTNSKLKKRLGWLAYTDPITRSVIGNKQFSLHYRLDSARARSLRAHTVIVGNCGTLTANILLLPDAVVDDGLLDIVLLRPKSLGGWARVGSRLALGGLLHRSKAGRLVLQGTPQLRALQYAQSRLIEVRFNRPENVELDGDAFGPISAARIAVVPAALSVRTDKPLQSSIPASARAEVEA
jgi:diacylglycerol kinase family enzyme